MSTLASRDQVSPFCGEWEPKTNGDKIRQMSNENLTDKDVLPMTVFEQITDSPEVLAEKLVYSFKVCAGLKQMYSSSVIDVCYHRRANAIKATVAKLKEVCYE